MSAPSPQSPSRPTLATPPARIAADIAHRLKAVADAADRVHGGRDDDASHDLRVALRRLDASLRLWEPLLDPRPRRRARRRLRRLRRALGPLREAEVVRERLNGMINDTPGEMRVAIEDVLARLARRIERRRGRASKRARPRAIERLTRNVEDAAARLPVLSLMLPGAVAERRAAVATLGREAAAAVATAVAGRDTTQLHAARVAVKKFRYALECLGPVQGEEIDVRGLREIQQALGNVQDLVTMEALIARRQARLVEQGSQAGAQVLAVFAARLAEQREEAIDHALVRAERRRSLLGLTAIG